MVEWAELAEPEGRAVDSGFAVSLDVYSGPFDVLLGMIAGNRLELTEVSLSAITEEFLEYVRGMDVARNMEAASSFIDVASILVEAKSAALLPGDEDGGRDERSMEACCSTARSSRPPTTSVHVWRRIRAGSRIRR